MFLLSHKAILNFQSGEGDIANPVADQKIFDPKTIIVEFTSNILNFKIQAITSDNVVFCEHDIPASEMMHTDKTLRAILNAKQDLAAQPILPDIVGMKLHYSTTSVPYVSANDILVSLIYKLFDDKDVAELQDAMTNIMTETTKITDSVTAIEDSATIV